MRLASRKFVIDAEGGVFRLADATFDRMLHDAPSHRLMVFADQRIRMASYLVEVADRRPVRAVWTSYSVLAFDGLGRLDTARLLEQQFARAEAALSLQTEDDAGKVMVVDAAARFVAQGGSGHRRLISPPHSVMRRWIDSRSAACGQSAHRRRRGRRDVGRLYPKRLAARMIPLFQRPVAGRPISQVIGQTPPTPDIGP